MRPNKLGAAFPCRRPATDKSIAMHDNGKMTWNFVKMHGAGNDFIMLDGVRQNIDMTPERARGWRIAILASAPTKSCWSRPRCTQRLISAIAFQRRR